MDEDEDLIRRKSLGNRRTIEDTWRDDMVALTYMNSSKFGSGIDVMPGKTAKEFEGESLPSPEVSPSVEQKVQFASFTQDVSAAAEFEEPANYAPIDVTAGPPPREPLPSPEDFLGVLGLDGGELQAGVETPEAPPPAPPILAIQPANIEVPQEQLFAGALFEQEVEPPSPPVQKDVPKPQASEPPSPQVTIQSEPEIPPDPQVDAGPALPFLGEMKFNPESPYMKQQLQGDMEEHGPQEILVGGMDELARAQAAYLSVMSDILYGMADKLDEAMGRLREIESVIDRRYQRVYR